MTVKKLMNVGRRCLGDSGMSGYLAIRLQKTEIEKLKRIAVGKGLPVSTMVRGWIEEKLKGDKLCHT